MRRAGVLPVIGWLLMLVAVARLEGQSASGGVDLGLANDYVWRGVTLANRPTLHPAAWAALHAGAHTTAAGAWAWVEPRKADPEQLTGAGRGAGRLAEVDLWAQHSWKLLTAGIIHYRHTGDAESGVGGGDASATELYLRVWPPAGALPLEPRLTGYLDVRDDRGGYVELSLTESIPILPLWPNVTPTGDLLVQATTGAFLDHEPGRAGAAPPADAKSRGISHVDLAATATVQLPASTYGHFTVHHQWSIDEATRRTSPGERRGTRWWFEGGISVLFGDPEP